MRGQPWDRAFATTAAAPAENVTFRRLPRMHFCHLSHIVAIFPVQSSTTLSWPGLRALDRRLGPSTGSSGCTSAVRPATAPPCITGMPLPIHVPVTHASAAQARAQRLASIFELHLDGQVVAAQLALHLPGVSYVHSSGCDQAVWRSARSPIDRQSSSGTRSRARTRSPTSPLVRTSRNCGGASDSGSPTSSHGLPPTSAAPLAWSPGRLSVLPREATHNG